MIEGYAWVHWVLLIGGCLGLLVGWVTWAWGALDSLEGEDEK